MTLTLHSYPAYKPSGVPWLGDVPAHWEVLPGRASYSSSQMPNKGLLEATVLSLSYGQIKIRPEENLHGLVPASFETYQIVEPDDIICRPTDLQNDWNSLRFGLSKNRGIITSAYIRLRTRPLLRADYGYLLLHTYDLKKVFYGLGSGLRQNLAWGRFQTTPMPCPTPRRAARHRPLLGPRGPAHPAVRERQTAAHCAAGGGEAGRRQPGRHPRPRPPTSASSPPASSGWATCRSIGRCLA